MQPMKLDVFVAMFCYGGNGGVGMQLPEITMWWAKTAAEMSKDPRIGNILAQRFGDVPLTMERNRAVRMAKDKKCDVLLMIDSDNVPDLYIGMKDWAKPFWSTSFDFLYERKLRGIPTVVCAPYCGPPPHPVKGGYENVYVFFGEGDESDTDQPQVKFQGYSRDHAAQMRGLQSIAAGPTGVIMYSLDAFDLMPVHKMTQEEILCAFKEDRLTLARAKRLLNMQSWFFYEYTDGEQTQKASTEDVTNTREIQFGGLLKHKEPVVFCNWDSWAGHYKPKCVGMPEPIFVQQISDQYREAVDRNLSIDDELREVSFLDQRESHGRILKEHEDVDISDILEAEKKPEKAEPVGCPIMKRTINGRVLTQVGNNTDDASLSALTALVRMIADTRQEKALRIVEVGSWVGESATAIHAGFGPAGGTIWCVDTWEGTPTDMSSSWASWYGHEKLYQTFLDNMGDLIDREIKVIKNDSVSVATSFDRPQDLDLVFIDAGHDYPSIAKDLEVWLPHVGHDGIICGHDYSYTFPGVIQAVDEVCDSAGILPKSVNGTYIWFFLKADYERGLAEKNKRKEKRARTKAIRQEVLAGHESGNSDSADSPSESAV